MDVIGIHGLLNHLGRFYNYVFLQIVGNRGQVPNDKVEERSKRAGKADRGGGGGGFYISGSPGDQNEGGKSYLEGGMGGGHSNTVGGHGGFGGGAGALYEGGGGGGYGGGDCCLQNSYGNTYPENGAMSFNSGSLPTGESDKNNGDGYVTITKAVFKRK